MQCPNDGATLVMADRQGIEIDYCPQCRGVWLDRGELDKLIERSQAVGGNTEYRQPERQYRQEKERRSDYREHHGDSDGHHKKRKKEGFLGDLFDF